jgi:SH3 domain-containing YSC84-like protein 1
MTMHGQEPVLVSWLSPPQSASRLNLLNNRASLVCLVRYKLRRPGTPGDKREVNHANDSGGCSDACTCDGKGRESAKRLGEAATVFSEVMATPDKGVPQEMLDNAHCIVIVPGLKTAAFLVGGKYGKGYVSCRNKAGAGWSAPGTVRIEGGSVGFQLGGSTTDLIMLVMNERGADKLLSSKFTLGAEGSVAAGPVGRTATAQTDVQMHAEILSWSRSQGLFAGLALEGATLRQDLDDNATLYGKKLENREIVTTAVRTPRAAARLIGLLDKYSARERGRTTGSSH